MSITVRDFFYLLFGDHDREEFEYRLGEQLSYAESETRLIDRRTAAYMVYVYITDVLHETEEPSIEPAFVLKDIYECPACIRYVAEVYLKGIMTAKDKVFGVKEKVEEEEAAVIVSRVFDRSKRFGGI
ncbi:MAG: hypothetical protein K5795_02535 [Lachnospiraceae bacterium]|nr:hypothetical protein [Lachnospiraceae bacterium]